MDEYINREVLRDSVESIDWYSVRRGELITGAESSENALYKANDIYSAIDNAPTADVVKVRHGRWVKIYENGEPAIEQHKVGVFCSRCIRIPKDRFTESNFCPNCGAKMDGGAD